MDPQKSLFVDKHVITTIRWVGFAVSEVLATIAILVYYRLLNASAFAPGWCWPLAVGFIVIGLLQGFWNPYTRRKVLIYVYTYCALGALLSIFVLGFSTVIFLGWLLLSMVMVIYFDKHVAAVGLGMMVASAVGWLLLHLDNISAGDVVGMAGNCVVVIAIVAIVAAIWKLTNNSVKQLEASHHQQDYEHEQLTSLINSMADGVIAVNAHAKVVLYNAAALNVLDLNSSMRGHSLGKFLKPLNAEQQPVDIVELVKNAKLPTINRDLRLKYDDGSLINLYLAIAPVHLGYRHGGTQGSVIMLRDITREKSLEEERDEFISVVSHELRTPIAIAEGSVSNAQVIADRTGDIGQIKTTLKQSHDQILFLADMINDLATLSRAERGKLTLEIEEIHVDELVADLAKSYQEQAAAKNLEIKTDVAVHLPYLHSGTLYVREVLQNFITNAIKYTEAGHITIAAKPGEHGVIFEVSDTGIGISKGDQERVFDKFFRSEDYRTRQNNGTGLGLYVTMKLARLLHADINLTSELNKGSTFSIFLPDLKADKPAGK